MPNPNLEISVEPPYFVGRAVGFFGWVDDFEHSIAAVQFSLDGGVHWTEYATPGTSADRGARWRFTYTPRKAGHYLLSVRAVSGTGETSTLVSGYAFQVFENDTATCSEQYHNPNGSAQQPVRMPENNSGQRRNEKQIAQETDTSSTIKMRAAAASLPFGSFHLRPIGEQRWGASKLYRSGELFGITSAEAAFLTHDLGIRTVYDIRNEFETAAHPQPFLMGAKTVALVPNMERRRKDANKRLVAGVIDKYGEPEQRMRQNYRRYAHEYPLIGKALRSMAAEGAPALVHCVNGKDRTGVLCATLLRIAGFSNEFIVADYLHVNKSNARQIAEEEKRLGAGMTPDEHAILMSFLEARPSYLAAFFDEAETQYGSFKGFIERGLRLTPEQIDVLKFLIGS